MELEEEMKLVDAVILTEAQEASIDEALRNATNPEDYEVAVQASFDVRNRLLLLELKTGQRLAIPQEDIQDIHTANPADLTEVEILGPGTALHWEKLMEGAEVDALRRGLYGNEQWMNNLAQRRQGRLQRAS